VDRAWLGAKLPHENNFDLVRLFAALQVLIYHAAHHLDAPLPAWVDHALQQFRGVPIFFFISGVLVASSLAGRGSVTVYLERRARRVLPALWLAGALGLLTLALFGQIGGELRSLSFWAWLVSQLTVLQVYNPDFFRDYGVGVLNGSLWTIPVEITFYLLLPAAAWLAAFADNRRRAFVGLLVLGSLVSYLTFVFVLSYPELFLARLLKITVAPHLWIFGFGVLVFVHFHRASAIVRRSPALFPAAYLIFAFVLRPHLIPAVGELLGQALLSMAVLAVAIALPPVSPKLLRGTDVSYGLYLFHMLVVNVLVELGWRGYGAVLVTLFVTTMIAAISWFAIERPALRGRFFPRPSPDPVAATGV
jgi:peptidoglycan/LPS O-acetylase OafA/YrhL